MSPIETYLSELSEKFSTGRAGEHAYRPAFERLVAALDPTLRIVNDPKRTEYGAPDFIFSRGDLIAGYAETKDVDGNLDKTEVSEQLKRYFGYSNLILTNYLEFRFFRNGERYGESITIGKIAGDKIIPQPKDFSLLTSTLRDFLSGEPEQIKSGTRLAKIMGGKARRIRDNVRQYLATSAERNRELERIYETIKKLLVNDLSPEHFADLYAQTLVYGLFAARFHDKSKEPFTRQKARDLVPASNPFLRHFFDHIVGPDFDIRLAYIVNELCEIFSHADVHALMGQYFKKNGEVEGPDPVIHFYEDFLKEYDPEQRKKVGAFYTPLPVVRFIVRSVDAILEKDFGLVRGLADTSKISIERTRQGKKAKIEVHRVQILDPATGTGTFLNETVRAIAKRFEGQAGRWAAYVDDDLLPRLHGFELMMASYTIAHLKLGMTLQETGYTAFDRRLGIYLTNSLEEGELPDDTLFGFGFSQSIADEAREAAVIKRETPIMVVIGNPPYSVSSSNKGEWIQNLIKDYKEGLGERKINLDDDYIKFIRLAENFIEENKSGIVAMITNNSYLDGTTHRLMRKHLLKTFDDIYILDLHGNSKKKEKALDGGKDENVFAIQQGVAIAILIRKEGTKRGLGSVHHAEFYGTRKSKFVSLDASTIQTIKYQTLDYKEPSYFFVPKDFAAAENYEEGFLITELCPIYTSGMETQKDSLVIQFTEKELDQVRDDIETGDKLMVEAKYGVKDTRDWTFVNARKDLSRARNVEILYRPFDPRWTFYSGNTKGIVAYPRAEIMGNLLKDNLALITTKRQTSFDFQHVFVSKSPAERCAVSLQTGEVGYVFPLYLYLADGTREPNLEKRIAAQIEKIVGTFSPEDIFDYIYAVLHSLNYREKYKAFLKIDFPRVPYPKDEAQFQHLVTRGNELRSLHLLESPKLNSLVTTYPVAGDNRVEKIKRDDSNVFINTSQYFGDVPEVAWNFYIGGYQPAQKWLKDRKGRVLSSADIEHYQKVIIALTETGKLMKEIDEAY